MSLFSKIYFLESHDLISLTFKTNFHIVLKFEFEYNLILKTNSLDK